MDFIPHHCVIFIYLLSKIAKVKIILAALVAVLVFGCAQNNSSAPLAEPEIAEDSGEGVVDAPEVEASKNVEEPAIEQAPVSDVPPPKKGFEIFNPRLTYEGAY